MYNIGKKILYKAIAVTVVAAILFFLQANVNYADQEIPDAAEETDQQGQYGGTLIFTTPDGESATVLGYPATASNSLAIMIAAPAVEQLFRLNEDGGLIPWLVRDYETSQDGLTYTFHLQEGVMFHDGTPFNAEAVRWNLQCCIDEGRNASVTDNIAHLQVVDEYTIEIHLFERDFQFLHTLSGNVGMMVSPIAVEEHGEYWAAVHPVGTGPFIFESWEVDSKIVYPRNDHSWIAGLPYLDGVEYHIVKDSAVMAAAFEQGELHAIAQVTDSLLTSLSQQTGCVKTVGKQAAYGYMLWFSSADPQSPFSNLKVRQAALYAIDMEAITQYLIGKTGSYTNQLSSVNSQFYNPEIEGYPYNPQKAKELLAQAGYQDGFSTTIYMENNDLNAELGAAVQAYLDRVGIHVTVMLMDAAQYYEEIILTGWEDGIGVVKFGYAPNEFSSMKGLLSRETHATRMPALSLPNEFFYALDLARAQATEADAIPYIQQAEKILIDDYAIGTGWVASSIAVKKDTVYGDHFCSLGRYIQWTPESAYFSEEAG